MRDIKDNWQLIPADDLAYCESSLTFCDGKGMRFHLPAFIMLELNNEGTGSVLYNLTHYYKFNKEKFNILNSDQKHAVATFLEWCFMEPNYEFDKPHIQRAIEEYWYEN